MAESRPLRVATLTLSDSRTPDDDLSGAKLRDGLVAAGFELAEHAIVREDRDRIHAAIGQLCRRDDVHAVITTGGTGISPRDVTVEVIAPLFDKQLGGFGEAFRRLSWDQIGARAVLSRAVAGIVGTTFVACLPGSKKAIELALERLLAPTLRHAVDLATGRHTHHHHGSKHGG
jgi:molybdenum cofactor biosynthesis protein B